jgi:hypothetical protein
MNNDADQAVRNRLAEVRDSLADVHMTIPASEIIARDRRHRTRRRHGLAAAGAACAATGLAVALALAQGSPARPVPQHAQLAAWTVDTNPDGTVTFTLRNTSHPAQLQHALAEAGVPAVVRWGQICEAGGKGQPLMDTEAFVKESSVPGLVSGVSSYFALQAGTSANPDLDWSWTVIPSKIPHGGQFVISAIPGSVPAGDIQAVWEFVHSSAPLTCATHMKA